MYTYIYVYTYICIQIHMYVWSSIAIAALPLLLLLLLWYICMCIYICVCIYIHVWMCTCIFSSNGSDVGQWADLLPCILQQSAAHCITLQHTATHCDILQHTVSRQISCCICCNRLQQTATDCSRLQISCCTYCNTQQHSEFDRRVGGTHQSSRVVLRSKIQQQRCETACNLCCSVLQCVAVFCSVLQTLQRVAVCCIKHTSSDVGQHPTRASKRVLQCVAMCCSILQYVPVCFSMLYQQRRVAASNHSIQTYNPEILSCSVQLQTHRYWFFSKVSSVVIVCSEFSSKQFFEKVYLLQVSKCRCVGCENFHTITCNRIQKIFWHPTHIEASRPPSLYPPTTHCNALQRTATHCNTLQHTATHLCSKSATLIILSPKTQNLGCKPPCTPAER